MKKGFPFASVMIAILAGAYFLIPLYATFQCRQIDRRRRLADPALLVRHSDTNHAFPRFFGTMRPWPTRMRLSVSVRLCST